ncbi:MAG: universal stress protein [Desulfurococcales archaeon]|nr:universal stress protein [Desulfurococcales archaeon]
MYSKILVGFDGSEASYKAVMKAADLAQTMGADLIIVSVVPPPTALLGELMTPEVIDPKPLADAARSAIKRLKEKLEKEKGVTPETEVLLGDPAEAIVELAKEKGADLIVLGRRGLSRLERLFVGSVTRKVLERAETDVLVVID